MMSSASLVSLDSMVSCFESDVLAKMGETEVEAS